MPISPIGEKIGYFHVIEPIDLPPQTQYDYPNLCRHCDCKLNRYNPVDSCYSCREKGRKGSPRDKRSQKEVKIEELLKFLRRVK